jgi:uncharacterized membrane protein YdbT with pleckstrin-like domain
MATGTETAIEHEAETDGIDLMQNESVLENRRPGWSVWWQQLAVAALLILAGAQSVEIAFVGALVVGYVVLSRMQSRYIVTDERIRKQVGLISSASREYRIPDIESLSSSQSIFERVLGLGNITVRTSSNDSVTWEGVPKYEEVSKTIREEQRAYDAA